jgi:predicted enzyme related to lactoylglutathione lyase
MTDEQSHEFTRSLYGSITHTELATTDPAATSEWCAAVLGWEFRPPFPTPAGDYHLYAYSETGGGGVRQTAPGEAPGSTPTVHVSDTQATYDAALAAGAESVNPPEDIMPGVRVALVRAPGGVLIGFSGPTEPVD